MGRLAPGAVGLKFWRPADLPSAFLGTLAVTQANQTVAAAASTGIYFRSQSSTAYAAHTSTTNVTCPAGVVDGDILLAGWFIGWASVTPTGVTAPAGWTQIGTTTNVVDNGGFHGQLYIYWKRAASEPSNYNFLHDLTQNTEVAIAAYSGCFNSGSPVDVSSVNFGTGSPGTTATALSITTSAPNYEVIYIGHNWDATGTLSPPAGMTERYDHIVYVSDQLQPSAGASGNRTQTLTSTNPWAAVLLALKSFDAVAAITVGTLGVTQADQTIAAAGSVTVGGTLSATQANQSIVAVGSVAVGGTLGLTAANNTLTATGGSVVGSTLNVIQANQTLSANGTVISSVVGTVNLVQASQTLTAAGTSPAVGTLNIIQAAQSLAALGSVTVDGVLAAAQASETLVATGHVAVDGTLSVTQADQTLFALGADVVGGVLGIVQDDESLSAAALVAIDGILEIAQDTQTIQASGLVLTGIGGGINAIQDAQTLIAAGRVLTGEIRTVYLTGGKAPPPQVLAKQSATILTGTMSPPSVVNAKRSGAIIAGNKQPPPNIEARQ